MGFWKKGFFFLSLPPSLLSRPQEQYRLQYPHLTEEQVAHATKAYIMQLQSGFTRKPAYDRSHYQEVGKGSLFMLKPESV